MKLRSLLPVASRLRPQIQAELSRGTDGFVLVRITNHGPDMDDATLMLSVPSIGAQHWIARVDPGGNPAMQQGHFEHGGTDSTGQSQTVSWHESGLAIPGGGKSSEFRFFVGLAASAESCRFDLRSERPDQRARPNFGNG